MTIGEVDSPSELWLITSDSAGKHSRKGMFSVTWVSVLFACIRWAFQFTKRPCLALFGALAVMSQVFVRRGSRWRAFPRAVSQVSFNEFSSVVKTIVGWLQSWDRLLSACHCLHGKRHPLQQKTSSAAVEF